MQQEHASQRVVKNALETAESHIALLNRLYETPNFPADALTEYFLGTRTDILTPGHKAGVEKLTQFADLVTHLKESTRYIAVVRTINRSRLRHANLISYPDGQKVEYASVRVFEDLTADKITISDWQAQDHIGGDDVIVPYKAIVFNQASLFTSSNDRTVYTDSDAAILETTFSRRDALYGSDTRQDEEVAYSFLFAQTKVELIDQLVKYGSGSDSPMGQLGGLVDKIEEALN